jgi:tetratricopeptide (TPR) repeat protein
LGFLCFRTIELNYSGSIERKMYEYILKADFVVADLSTLNPNALYELGVRHALKPFTTIMIGESSLFGDKSKGIPSRLPFDLNHYVIIPYEHLGTEITAAEKEKFHQRLKKLITELKDKDEQDSPVFDNLKLTDSFSKFEIKAIKEDLANGNSLQDILKEAETLKKNNKLSEALAKFKEAREMVHLYQHNDSEYITQRIVLCTYKSNPNDLATLQEAWNELKKLEPEKSNNTETLGLAGAIQKRLYEISNNIEHAELAHKMYNKGFIINDDYYTGINAAFMQNVLAQHATEGDFYNQLADYTRLNVLKNINAIIQSGQLYQRNDTQWILQTKAEAEFMLDKTNEYQKTLIKLEDLNVPFNSASFNEQMEKLKKMK